MKQFVIIPLICLYALSTLGVGLRQFYCCGKLQSSTIGFILDLKQKCAKVEEKDRCCKTKFASFQVKDSHFAIDGPACPVNHFDNNPLFTCFYEAVVSGSRSPLLFCATHAPPPGDHPRIYLLYRNFRI